MRARRVASSVALFLVAGACYGLGSGGYPAGELLTTAGIGGAAALAVAVCTAHDTAYRGAWILAAGILGVVVGSVIAGAAPWGPDRIAATLDTMHVEGYTLTAERRTGSPSCIPECPLVERTYRGPAIAPGAAAIEFGVALVEAGIASPELLSGGFAPQFHLDGDEFDLEVEATRADPVGGRIPPVQVRVRAASRR